MQDNPSSYESTKSQLIAEQPSTKYLNILIKDTLYLKTKRDNKKGSIVINLNSRTHKLGNNYATEVFPLE